MSSNVSNKNISVLPGASASSSSTSSAPSAADMSAAEDTLQGDVEFIASQVSDPNISMDAIKGPSGVYTKLTQDIKTLQGKNELTGSQAAQILAMVQNDLLPISRSDSQSITSEKDTIRSFLMATTGQDASADSSGTSGPSLGTLQTEFQAVKDSASGSPTMTGDIQSKIQTFLNDVGRSNVKNKGDLLNAAGAFVAALGDSTTPAASLTAKTKAVDTALGEKNDRVSAPNSSSGSSNSPAVSKPALLTNQLMVASQAMEGLDSKDIDGRTSADFQAATTAAANGDAAGFKTACSNLLNRDLKGPLDSKSKASAASKTAAATIQTALNNAYNLIVNQGVSSMSKPTQDPLRNDPTVSSNAANWATWADDQGNLSNLWPTGGNSSSPSSSSSSAT